MASIEIRKRYASVIEPLPELCMHCCKSPCSFHVIRLWYIRGQSDYDEIHLRLPLCDRHFRPANPWFKVAGYCGWALLGICLLYGFTFAVLRKENEKLEGTGLAITALLMLVGCGLGTLAMFMRESSPIRLGGVSPHSVVLGNVCPAFVDALKSVRANQAEEVEGGLEQPAEEFRWDEIK